MVAADAGEAEEAVAAEVELDMLLSFWMRLVCVSVFCASGELLIPYVSYQF
jgi:hypothetical protein